MKEILVNSALIDLNNFCKENNIDCSDTHLLKRAREYTYDLMRKGKPFLILLFLLMPIMAYASDVYINMAVIAKIESSNNPLAYNKHSGAIGLCQITPIVLKEYNQFNHTKYTKHDLFNPRINLLISEWYFNKRIPQLLKHFKKADTLRNRLICYNAGISYMMKIRIPDETKNYILKYERLLKNK